ncbi:hypothetical protein COCOBI_07-2410 [Coccomyxa sp. Obi]|nr:hypothetical protein COCOBI_07-2410 [Coccomyxa sp. Obi]
MLCTPQLEQAHRALQAGSAAAAPRVAAPMRKGVRKITPTGPPQQAAAAAAQPPQVPDAMAAALARTADPDQLQLQSAFLLMYSNPESKVRLKTTVDFVGDTLGHTVRAAAVKVAAASAAEEASRQLRPLVKTSAEALRSANRQVTAEILKASLQPRLVQIKSDMMEKAMEAACKSAMGHAEGSAVQALAALAHPSWTPAVIGAAAAIAADSSAAACARRLVTEVPDRVAAILQAQMDEAVSAIVKSNAGD